MARHHRISPSCRSSVGVSPAAVATAADARCPGWRWAMTSRTGCRPTQSTSPCAASVAMPRRCHGVPTTQAISATRPVPAGRPSPGPCRSAGPRRGAGSPGSARRRRVGRARGQPPVPRAQRPRGARSAAGEGVQRPVGQRRGHLAECRAVPGSSGCRRSRRGPAAVPGRIRPVAARPWSDLIADELRWIAHLDDIGAPEPESVITSRKAFRVLAAESASRCASAYRSAGRCRRSGWPLDGCCPAA